MDRDYQALALCNTFIGVGTAIDAAAASKDTGASFDHATIVCLEVGMVSTIVQKFPQPGMVSDTNVNMAPGSVLYNIKSCYLSSGRFQVIFHKS